MPYCQSPKWNDIEYYKPALEGCVREETVMKCEHLSFTSQSGWLVFGGLNTYYMINVLPVRQCTLIYPFNYFNFNSKHKGHKATNFYNRKISSCQLKFTLMSTCCDNQLIINTP